MVESKSAYDILRAQFINDFLRPIWQQFVQMAILQGLITLPRSLERASLLQPAWSTPGTPWIDPQKEAQANQILLENNLISHSEIIRATGRDPAKVFKEIQLEKTMDLFEVEEPPAPAAPEPDDEDNDEDDDNMNGAAANA